MIDALQNLTESLPPLLQWVGIILASAIPFIESYFGSIIGILAGINPVIAILAAIIGNTLSMIIVVLSAHHIRTSVTKRQNPKPPTPRKERLRKQFDKYGVPGVSLLGQTILPSQMTAAAMVSFGASKNSVILWQIISITLWGIAFGALAALGTSLL
jgi:membrane protein YqaA with SNARE-associated domain